MSKPRSLVTGGALDPLLPRIEDAARSAAAIDIVVAFTKRSGVETLHTTLRAALSRGAHVRVLTGDYLAITDPDALAALLLLDGRSEEEDEGPALGVSLRVIEVSRLPPPTESFHPKSWIFQRDDGTGEAFVGSSNLSRAALETAIEWNLHVSEREAPQQFREIRAAFEMLWSQASSVTPTWLAEYRQRPRPHTTALEPPEDDPVDAPPEPHQAQREALLALSELRRSGETRALVVLATGLGKTLLAAFDYAQLRQAQGKPLRLLFVAHRIELLQHASEAFRRVCAAHGWPVKIGWCVGALEELDQELVFASVAKLSREGVLTRLQLEDFDYVVVDEVHHAAAASYQRILSALRETFVLGLTATPERMDQADILTLFGNRIAYRANIVAGIELGRLVRFDYFGLKDTIDFQQIPWRSGSMVVEALARAAAQQERMQVLWKAWEEHPARRTLVFCCTKQHALFARDWLREKGVRVNAVFSGPTSDDREESLRLFGQDKEGIDALCVVDLFNEGLDVPAIDRVVMLRPTESQVVFLQQLGRGLRAHPGKSRLLIIDFVGNHELFAERLRVLFEAASAENTDALVTRTAHSKEPVDVHGCRVSLELEAKELLRDILRAEREQAPEALAPPHALLRADRIIDRLWLRPEADRHVMHGDGRRALLAERSSGLLITLKDQRAFVSRNAIAWASELEEGTPGVAPERVVVAQFPALDDRDDGSALLPPERVELASWALAMVRQAGPLRRSITGLRVRDEDGREMDATFSIEPAASGAFVYFESRGENRNTEYGPALERLLARISGAHLQLREVSLASTAYKKSTSAPPPLPLDGPTLEIRDPTETRKAIGREVAKLGRVPEAKGAGNATKRLRLSLSFAGEVPKDEDLVGTLRDPKR